MTKQGRPKISIEEVVETFKKNGLILINSNYLDATKPLTAKTKDGYLVEAYYHNVKKGKTPKLFHSSNPHTIENIRKWMLINAPDYELLSTKYNNGSEKLVFRKRESDMPTFQMAWRVFKVGHRHPLLSKEHQKIPLKELVIRVNKLLTNKFPDWKIDTSQKIEYSATKTLFNLISDDGYKYITTIHNLQELKSIYLLNVNQPEISLHNIKQFCINETNFKIKENQTYKGNKIKLTFVCDSHGEFELTPNHLIKGIGCKECSFEQISGENSPHWNPSLTEEERVLKRKYVEYYDWIEAVYERDNYTCQCCGQVGGTLNAHHKDGYNWCKGRRTDVSNGVTLCVSCHRFSEFSFHKIYGNKENTEQQFNEWISLYKGRLIAEKEMIQ